METNTPLQTLKGFRDFLGAEKVARDYLAQKFKQVFQLFGFEPLETPTLEYASLLLGKYGAEADKLVYKFADPGGREVALRYDQTVPTSRILIQYNNQLPKFYRRYQIQNVFRAEKPQKGRFREFTQCDIDIFGTTSSLADAEIVACVYQCFRAIGFNDIQIRLNDRNLLFETLAAFASQQVDVFSIIQSIDKLDKLSSEEVINELTQKGLDQAVAEQALTAIQSASMPTSLNELITQATALGVNKTAIKYTPTLARGLDYYTGPIFEFISPSFSAGSLGGGGRYDKLIGQLGGKDIPATGFAFGFDRILVAAQEMKLLSDFAEPNTVLVSVFNQEMLAYSLQLAQALRAANVPTVVYPQVGDKLDKQFRYADQLKAKYLIIAGPEEFAAKTVQVKNLASGEQRQFSQAEITKLAKS